MARQKTPARWYLDIGRDTARTERIDPDLLNDYLRKQREQKRALLIKDVKELRKVFPDFDARKGYDLRDVKSWPAKRAHEVEKYARYLHNLTSQPHSFIKPQNKTQRRALETFTGQIIKGKRQRRFVVQKDSPTEKVSITKKGVISIRKALPEGRGTLRSDYYLFAAYLPNFYREEGRDEWEPPVTWDDVYAQTIDMLPFMPEERRYIVMSRVHGEIDLPQWRRQLGPLMLRYGREYNEREGFASTIMGFKQMADDIKISDFEQQRYDRRQKHKERRAKEYNELLRKIGKDHGESRALWVRCSVCKKLVEKEKLRKHMREKHDRK